jgi:hypothetical protein
MLNTLSDRSSALHPHNLTDGELLIIGRLIRACAEIDEIANLYVTQLTGVEEFQSLLIYGRMATSARLQIAERFAKLKGESALKLHKECFANDEYENIIKLRNTVAHGNLLGKTDDGSIAFEMQQTTGHEENRFFTTVNAYSSEAFEGLTDIAVAAVDQLLDRLDLRAARDAHRKKALSPHPNHRPKRHIGAKASVA